MRCGFELATLKFNRLESRTLMILDSGLFDHSSKSCSLQHRSKWTSNTKPDMCYITIPYTMWVTQQITHPNCIVLCSCASMKIKFSSSSGNVLSIKRILLLLYLCRCRLTDTVHPSIKNVFTADRYTTGNMPVHPSTTFSTY